MRRCKYDGEERVIREAAAGIRGLRLGGMIAVRKSCGGVLRARAILCLRDDAWAAWRRWAEREPAACPRSPWAVASVRVRLQRGA